MKLFVFIQEIIVGTINAKLSPCSGLCMIHFISDSNLKMTVSHVIVIAGVWRRYSKGPSLKLLDSFGKYKSPTSKGWSYPDGNWYKNVRYDVFLGLSVLKTSPVNFWLNSSPNLCKTTLGNINLRSSSIYQNSSGCLPFTEIFEVVFPFQNYFRLSSIYKSSVECRFSAQLAQVWLHLVKQDL